MLKTIIHQAKLFYSSSSRFRGLIKKATASRPYHRVTKRWVKRQIAKDQEGLFNLVIETANICNARCVMCPYRLMRRSKKIMEQKTFDKIVGRVKEEKLRINKVFFSGLGEPLIDPQIVSRIRVFKKLGFRVKLYTNASLLTPKISQRLVDLKLDEMNISFNGVTPKQYQKVMGLDFAKTVTNIDLLLQIKKESGRGLPAIRISSIITKENEKDIERHIQNWSGKVDSVTVSLPHEWGGAVEIKSKINPPLADQSSKLTYPCRSLWHTFMIDSSGNFVICCRDYESKYVLGNVRARSFADIQKNPVMERFRCLHLEYLREKLPKICLGCNFPYQDGVEWYMPRSID